MGNKEMGAHLVLAWPITEIAIMGAEGAVRILYHKKIEAAEDKNRVCGKKIQEFPKKFMTPYYAATRRQLDVLIRPQETRPQIIRALEMLENKKVIRKKRRHGNIPL